MGSLPVAAGVRRVYGRDAVGNERVFSASVWQEGEWWIAQALEVDVASQGDSIERALACLGEALALHFEDPRATAVPEIHSLEVELGAA